MTDIEFQLGKEKKPILLIVGAFPQPSRKIFGGVLTICNALMESDFAQAFDLILIDSTQISNPPPNFIVRLFLAIKRLLIFMKVFFHRRPDAVLIFVSTGFSVLEKGAMSWISRLERTPVLLFPRCGALIEHAHSSIFKKICILSTMYGASYILCQGPAWQRFAIDVLGFKEEYAPVIHNWSATNRLLELGAKRMPSSNSSCTTLLFLGWLEQEKGVFDLLEAIRSIFHLYNFNLLVAGRGRAEEEMRLHVIQYGMQDRVEFLGWIQGQEKEALLEKSDILILPSWAEGFPNSVVEAMAAKVAVIVTTVGNIPDLLNNGQEALLVAPRDIVSLRNAIIALLEDSQLRLTLADRGHIFARNNFSVSVGTSKLADVIYKAIKEKQVRPCCVVKH